MGDALEEHIEGFIKFLEAGEGPSTVLECKLKFLVY